MSAPGAQPTLRPRKHVCWFVQRARDAGKEGTPCWGSDKSLTVPGEALLWLPGFGRTFLVGVTLLVLGNQFCSPPSIYQLQPWLFLSCLCCKGSQNPYMCPGTTKPLHELFFLPRIHEVIWRVDPLGGAVCGRVIVITLLLGLEWSIITLCSLLCWGI